MTTSLKPKTILLVEDNADDVVLILRAFRESGVPGELVVARDGQDALDFLFASGRHSRRSPAQAPHLVLLDLQMPGLDGHEVLRRIRSDSRTRMLPVVVLTSSHQERDIAESYRLGANSLVRKPADFARFVAAAAELGRYWLTLNQQPPLPVFQG